jgi:hypothetical protein
MRNAILYVLPILGLVILSSMGGRAIALAKQRSARLTLKTLKDSEYDNGEGTRKFRLRDGAFESGKPGGDYLHAEFEQAAFGDLNGDSVEDATVVFWWSGGGSGAFVTLAAVINEDGKPHNIATQIIGDRVHVTSVATESGIIVLHMRDHKPGGGLARATVPKVVKYQLLRGKLRKIGEESRPEATKRVQVKTSPESTLTGRGGKEAALQDSKSLGTSIPSLFASQ